MCVFNFLTRHIHLYSFLFYIYIYIAKKEGSCKPLKATLKSVTECKYDSFNLPKCITGNWKNAKYSLWLSGGNFDRRAYISQEAANELQWRIKKFFDAFASIKLPPFDLTTFSDASLEGWWWGTEQFKWK